MIRSLEKALRCQLQSRCKPNPIWRDAWITNSAGYFRATLPSTLVKKSCWWVEVIVVMLFIFLKLLFTICSADLSQYYFLWKLTYIRWSIMIPNHVKCTGCTFICPQYLLSMINSLQPPLNSDHSNLLRTWKYTAPWFV